MFCKFCGKELDENSSVCPGCGQDNNPAKAAKAPKKKLSPVKLVISITAVVLLLAVLVGVVYYGVTGGFTPKANDLFYKENYSVDADQVAANHDKIVATMGDYSLTNGQLQVFYWMQVYDFLSYYGYYATYMGLDYTQPLETQIFDSETGKNWQQYFLETALTSWRQYQALYTEAEKAGYQLDDEQQQYIDTLAASLEEMAISNSFANAAAMLQADMGPGITVDDYVYYVKLYQTGNLYFSSLVDEMKATDEEIETYFTENADSLASSYSITKESGKLYDVRNILIKPEGGTKDDSGNTVYSEDEWEACRQAAQDIYDAWLAGEMTEDTFSALATDNSKDSNASSGGLYSDLDGSSMTEVDVRHILIMPEGGTKDENNNTTYSDDEWEACRQAAQDIYDAWLAGEMTEDSFIAAAKEYSEDGNKDDGGLYTNVYVGQMVAEFEDWCFDESRQYGDHGLIKTKFGYHIMFFVRSDNAFDSWIADESRAAGDTTMVLTDDGYQILYFVDSEEGWIRYSREGVLSDKATDALKSIVEPYVLNTDYKKIAIGAADLSA